jgi:hypothetical protein
MSWHSNTRLDLHKGQDESDVGSYLRFWAGITLKSGLVTGRGAAGGKGNSKSRTLSDVYGKGTPFNSYLQTIISKYAVSEAEEYHTEHIVRPRSPPFS